MIALMIWILAAFVSVMGVYGIVYTVKKLWYLFENWANEDEEEEE